MKDEATPRGGTLRYLKFFGSKIWEGLTFMDQSFLKLFFGTPEILHYFFGSQTRGKVRKNAKKSSDQIDFKWFVWTRNVPWTGSDFHGKQCLQETS